MSNVIRATFPRHSDSRFTRCQPSPIDPAIQEVIETDAILSVIDELCSLSAQALDRMRFGSSEWWHEKHHLDQLTAERLGFEGQRERALGGGGLRLVKGGRDG